jgi:hypothetical protein
VPTQPFQRGWQCPPYISITAIGRATCDRLDMNDEKYKGERSIREARALWLEAGWHPPANDPRQLEV